MGSSEQASAIISSQLSYVGKGELPFKKRLGLVVALVSGKIGLELTLGRPFLFTIICGLNGTVVASGIRSVIQAVTSRDILRVIAKRSAWVVASSAALFIGILANAATGDVGKKASSTVQPSAEATDAKVKTIVFIGDSITAGYGVKKEESYPELLRPILKAAGHEVRIINGAISGSVTADADKLVRWQLRLKPSVLVLALGANDGLKGTPVRVIKKNLEQAVDVAVAAKVRVLLVGMRVFENLGPEYTKAFSQLFRDIAKDRKVAFMPFLLEGVALDKNLNQPDGKHPNPAGQEIIAKHVATALEKLL